MSTDSGRINYPDLDLVKLLMAICVVDIHTHPCMDLPTAELIIEGFVRLAVPFFFVASAFLCFNGLAVEDFASADSRGSVRVRKTMGRLLRLYLTWTLLYLPVTVFGNLLRNKSFLRGLLSFVKGTLLVGENFCSAQLWYLLASVVAFALVYLSLRGGCPLRRLLVIAASFLLFGYLLDLLRAWDEAPLLVSLPVKAYFAVFSNVRNGLFEGFFYVAVGAAFGMKHERLAGIPTSWLVLGVVLGIAGCIFVSNDAHLPFCACASICVFLLSVRRSGSDLSPHVGARNASTVIYLVHMFFAVAFVYGISGGTNPAINANEICRPLFFLFTLGASALFSVAILLLAKKAPALKRVFGI